MAKISKIRKKPSQEAALWSPVVKAASPLRRASQKLKTLSDKTLRVLRKAVISPALLAIRPQGMIRQKGGAKKKTAPKTFARIQKKMTSEQVKYLTPSPPRRASQKAVVWPPIAKAASQKAVVWPPIAKAAAEGPRKPEAVAVRQMQGCRIERTELPRGYGKDRIVLQVRDPWWLHAYWEVCEGTLQKLKDEFLALFDTARKALRVYDVSFIDFNGSNAHRYFDIELTHDCLNWYIDTSAPGRSWCVDLGLKFSDDRFITIVRSNTVTTPLDVPSWITDEEWMVPDELFAKLYATAVGLGGSPVKIKKPWLELQKRQFASGGISSIGISPVRKKEGLKRKFWLAVNTELIVYGATEPDAKVTVAGSPISLRSDGTFSLRFALPDGKQVIPVHAKSYDGIDERTITPVVIKETK